MKNRATQSATSLRRAPRDDAQSRMRKYFIMMSVRVVCFVLMVVITPYGWHTGILAVGAVLLPYLAVVVANVGSDARDVTAVPVETSADRTSAGVQFGCRCSNTAAAPATCGAAMLVPSR